MRQDGSRDGARTTDLVAIVDDDESVRTAVHGVLRSVGLKTQTFTSAEDFLDWSPPTEPGCLITDLRMPGMTGLELQSRLVELERRIPIIFMTAYGTPRMRSQALQAGAVSVLDKPFGDEQLLETVRAALER